MAVNIDGNGLIALGGTSSTQGRLRLAEDTDNGTNYIELTAPASVGSDRVITFPDASGTVDRLNRAGNVLQVVQNVYTVASQTGASSFVDTGLTATITPSSASSKILVMVSQPLSIAADTDTARDVAFNIVRDSTMITDGFAEIDLPGTSSFMKISAGNFIKFLDSPNTTSAITYKTQFKVNAGNADVYANQHGTESNIILMEIAG